MDDPQNSVAFKLHQATVLIDRLADDYLQREHGLRYSHFVVLLMARTLGPCTQQAIALNLGVSRASITQRVGVLAEDGFVVVSAHPSDSRAHLVALTELGTEKLQHAWEGLETRQDGLSDGVDEAILAAQLDTLIGNGLKVLRATT